MENSIIFVILTMFYICIVLPFQMRHYLLKRQRRLARLQEREPTLVNGSYHTTRTVTYLNSANNNNRPINLNRSTENSNDANGEVIFERVHMPPPRTRDSTQWNDENTAASEAASEAARHQEAEHRQQIIDIQRGIEEQAARRREERIPHPNAPHMPARLINSSTIRSSVFTINSSGHTTGLSNSSINYPYAPPLTPDSDGMKHLRMPEHLNTKDDGLPSYDQAVTFDSTTTVTIRRY